MKFLLLVRLILYCFVQVPVYTFLHIYLRLYCTIKMKTYSTSHQNIQIRPTNKIVLQTKDKLREYFLNFPRSTYNSIIPTIYKICTYYSFKINHYLQNRDNTFTSQLEQIIPQSWPVRRGCAHSQIRFIKPRGMMPKLTVQEQPKEMNTVYFISNKMELSCILHVLTNGIQFKGNCEIISESNMTTTIIQFK